jgi:hypothetical protein
MPRKYRRPLNLYDSFSVVTQEAGADEAKCFEFATYAEAATCYAKAIRSRLFESVSLGGFYPDNEHFDDWHGEVIREWPKESEGELTDPV